MARDIAPPDPSTLDTVLLLTVAGRMAGARVLADIVAAGHPHLRESDGYVFQHLVPGPLPVSDLAERLGVTQQAASKTVADLERRGYVRREADPTDARVRAVTLTPAGRDAVEAGRSVRRALEAHLTSVLGPTATKRFRTALQTALDELGGTQALQRRRVPAP